MIDVRIARDGSVRVLYADKLQPLHEALGEVTIRRASHVEPAPAGGGWFADMNPVGGPLLGLEFEGRLVGFPTRQEALDAETEWLVQHGIPIPKETA